MKYKIKYEMLELAEKYDVKINAPQKVIDFIRSDYNPLQEELILIGMDIKNNIAVKKIIAIGNDNTILITPKDIFIHLIINNCCNFILSHNHPSGDIKPSQEDIIFIKNIEKVSSLMGLNLLDNIIITEKDHYSFKQNGLI